MPPKRKQKSEEREVKKKARVALVGYDFFHEKPDSAMQETPSTLMCNGEQFHVFPQILGICSSRFSQRYEHVNHESRVLVNLDALDIRGVQVFAQWAMDHKNPVFLAINDEGNIMEDVIVCYITALRLRAFLLCDLILFQACKVGEEEELIVRLEHITKIYEETRKQDDALRSFVSSLIAYQRRNGLHNAIVGRNLRTDKQRDRFAAMPDDFQYDLMNELSNNTAAQNPCHRPKRFLKVVDYHKQKKEQRLEAEKARLERGTSSSPLFIEEE